MFEMSFDCKQRLFKCTDEHIWSPFRTTMKPPLVNILNCCYSFLQLSSSACSTRGRRSSASSAITCGCTWGRSSGTTTRAQPSTSTTLTASPCTWRPGWCSWTVLSAWSCGRKLSKQWKIFTDYLHCLRSPPNHSWWQITITKFQLSSGNQEMLFFTHPPFTAFITYQEKCERISHKRRCRGGKRYLLWS